LADNDAMETSSPLPLAELLKTVDELSDVDVDIDDASDETEKSVTLAQYYLGFRL